MYALKDENGDVTINMDEIAGIAEIFYAQLCDSNAMLENIPYRADIVSVEFQVITKAEIKKALKVIS